MRSLSKQLIIGWPLAHLAIRHLIIFFVPIIKLENILKLYQKFDLPKRFR